MKYRISTKETAEGTYLIDADSPEQAMETLEAWRRSSRYDDIVEQVELDVFDVSYDEPEELS